MIIRALLLASLGLLAVACTRTEGPATDNKEMSNTAPSPGESAPKDSDSGVLSGTNTDSGSHPEQQPAPDRTPAPKLTPNQPELPKESTKMK